MNHRTHKYGVESIRRVDASVLLRVALSQPDVLPEWSRLQRGVASALVMTASLRTLDRLRLRANLPYRASGLVLRPTSVGQPHRHEGPLVGLMWSYT